MKSYLGIAVVAGLAVVLSAGAGPAAGAAVAPQGTELFRCQVHRGGGRDTRPDNALKRMARFLNRKSQRYYHLKFAKTYYGEMTHYGLYRLAWADVRRTR